MRLGRFSKSKCYVGSALTLLADLPDESIDCCITSPPYWGQRSYLEELHPNKSAELGLEESPGEYVKAIGEVFSEVRRSLKTGGSLWLNLGDTYRDKNLCLIPFRVALELQKGGWILRSHIVWAKSISFCRSYVGSVMPESVSDRPSVSHESIFLFTKSDRYYFDIDSVREAAVFREKYDYEAGKSTEIRKKKGHPSRYGGESKGHGIGSIAPPEAGRNLRSVWAIPIRPYRGAHSATFPPELVAPMVKAGCPVGGVVLDPFMGSGTVAQVAQDHGREWLGFDLNPRNEDLIKKRTAQSSLIPFIDFRAES